MREINALKSFDLCFTSFAVLKRSCQNKEPSNNIEICITDSQGTKPCYLTTLLTYTDAQPTSTCILHHLAKTFGKYCINKSLLSRLKST